MRTVVTPGAAVPTNGHADEIPEREPTAAEKRDDTLEREPDLIGQLLAAGEELKTIREVVEIWRVTRLPDGTIVRDADGKAQNHLALSIPIRPITDQELENCQRQMQKKERRFGRLEVTDADNPRYRSLVVYTATLPNETTGRRLWDDQRAWEHFNVVTGLDLVDKLLATGEKGLVFSRILEISGFVQEVAGEQAKN